MLVLAYVQCSTSALTSESRFAGELPLELIRMKAKGCRVILSGNKGFTLPSNIGELGDDITQLDLSNCSLEGTKSANDRTSFAQVRKTSGASIV